MHQRLNKLLNESRSLVGNIIQDYSVGVGNANFLSAFDVFLKFETCTEEEGPFATPKDHRFIHYTSLDSFFQIFNSSSFKISSLSRLNDPGELLYGIKSSNSSIYSVDSFNKRKNDFYVGSFSDFDSESFDLFRLYGDDLKGVGIVFSLQNPTATWVNGFFGKVQYGEGPSLSNFNKFVKLCETSWNDPDCSLRVQDIVELVSLLHKAAEWQSEKEYRLILSIPFNDWDLEPKLSWVGKPYILLNRLSHQFDENGVRRSSIALPLNIEELKIQEKKLIENATSEVIKFNEGDFINRIPLLRIESIILGPKLNNQARSKIKQYINKLSKSKLGYIPKVTNSIFSENFQSFPK